MGTRLCVQMQELVAKRDDDHERPWKALYMAKDV
ncbi:uncharacterized protein G2W53_015490 [Senna tora]|uniref:Uncharacterized protein n=1 Tax=Senna tora TaxID=362788 RepID=A0A834WVS1_9FABA|nr:uncharacterized protein G2W53_015490 [Senna tora]